MKKLILASSIMISLIACSTNYEKPPALPEAFPTVKGSSLEEKEVVLPSAYSGQNTVALIGYLQRTQFDIDRWILGLTQAEVPVAIVEVPTITGMAPSLISDYIDDGMRSGIPREDWSSVVTVYSDEAKKIKQAFGNERPQNAQVVLLNKKGEVIWFYDRGYSAGKVLELKKKVEEL